MNLAGNARTFIFDHFLKTRGKYFQTLLSGFQHCSRTRLVCNIHTGYDHHQIAPDALAQKLADDSPESNPTIFSHDPMLYGKWSITIDRRPYRGIDASPVSRMHGRQPFFVRQIGSLRGQPESLKQIFRPSSFFLAKAHMWLYRMATVLRLISHYRALNGSSS